jgi:APA family basic amino acid/polyamine antiporter
VGHSQRNAGLLRAVGPAGLAASIVCQTVGAAIFVVPALLAANVGVYAPLAFLGREGLLPRVLGRIHGRSHAPYVAIAFYAGLAATLALTGTFAELAVLATLTSAAVYAGGSAAAWVLARRGIALAGVPLASPLLPAAATVGITGMTLLIALASRQEILGLAALMTASALVYLIQTRVVPARESAS